MDLFAFLGNDDLRKHEALEAALSAWGEGARDAYSGADVSWEQIAESFLSADLFSPRKALIIRNWDNKNLDKAPASAASQRKAMATPRQELEKLFAKDNPGVTVFLEGEKWDARSSLRKTATTAGRVNEFKVPYDEKIPQWIGQRAREKYSRAIANPEARLLQEIVGRDLEDLDHELEKLDTFLRKGAPITEADILDLASSLRVFGIFEFQKIMGLKKKAEMLPALRNLLEVEFKGVPFLIAQMLFNHFLKLLKIRTLRESGAPEASISEALKLNHYIFTREEFLRQAMSRSAEHWKRLLARLAKLESELKQGQYTRRFEVEMAFAVLLT